MGRRSAASIGCCSRRTSRSAARARANAPWPQRITPTCRSDEEQARSVPSVAGLHDLQFRGARRESADTARGVLATDDLPCPAAPLTRHRAHEPRTLRRSRRRRVEERLLVQPGGLPFTFARTCGTTTSRRQAGCCRARRAARAPRGDSKSVLQPSEHVDRAGGLQPSPMPLERLRRATDQILQLAPAQRA
jgi:hypothetical protein